ncbi:synaptojanin-2-binding protein-like [Amphiura filiformis]|uniref:synaptojanin-2-binding protein-like n=1 Tax=Amphiura filiformis TaxID=82378 RepID=UPI003B217CF7
MASAILDIPEDEIILERGTAGLGFNIKGGRDQPHVPRDPGIFVTKIRDDGAAAKDGRLKKGDKILEINDVDVRSVLHQDAVNMFVEAGETVKLIVQHGAEAVLQERYKAAQASRKENAPPTSKRKWWLLAGAGVAVVGVAFFYMKYRQH